ncbi:hypothetical protein [Candidiatus Paracoxiella cheracis]|uniref:hypothetical protein n=1 Tax=Candidiatus Paracoxiella cheracis TaxID=3405120 RepID=UPI003BF54535
MTLAERLRLEGRTIGKAEGKIEGRIEAAKEIAKRLLREGLAPDIASHLTGLSPEIVASLVLGETETAN